MSSTDGLRAALGPRPADFTAGLAWDQTVELVASRAKSRDRAVDVGLGL